MDDSDGHGGDADPVRGDADADTVGRADRAPLDEEFAVVVDEVASLGVPEWHELSVAAARRLEDDLFSPDADPAPVDLVRDLAFDGPAGEVPVRVYVPEGIDPATDAVPTLVLCHGGCWVMGTLDSVDDVCRALCRRVEGVVVSVDYRLAPEHPFPAAVEDATAAVAWARETAGTFGGDPDRVGVAGTSAGGTVAAAVALRGALDDEAPAVDAQCLLYPATDAAMAGAAYEENADGPLLTAADMAHYWHCYLLSSVHERNPLASPLRATREQLSGLPPAVVATAGNDPLRDDGAAYAGAMADAGVDVRHRHYPSLGHGFASLTDEVGVADDAVDDVAEDVRDLLSA